MVNSCNKTRALVRGFQCGMYTRMEVISQLVSLAADIPADAVAVDVPKELLAEIRRKAEISGCDLENIVVIDSALHRRDVDISAHHEDMQRKYHAGNLSWKRFFADAAKHSGNSD